MQKMILFLKSRAVLLMALLAVLGGALGLIAPVETAHSAICNFRPIIRTYYSDATHTTEVGQRGTDCGCNPIFWGLTSSFVVSQQLCCSVNTC
jgi:hypothetical protein